MSKSTVILGKAGTGKTFVAAHLAMSLGYLGEKTLLVGCDQKQDTVRALSGEHRASLMEAIERADFETEQVDVSKITVSISDYVDVLELGPSQLIVGHYGSVFESALQLFRAQQVLERYDQLVFDVSEERFDSAFAPLFRWVDSAIAVSDDSAESLFVLNRLLRASLIGYAEYQYPMRVLGAINNRSLGQTAFSNYVEKTQCFALMTVPQESAFANLRQCHKSLFALEKPSREQDQAITDFINVANLMRANPLNLVPVSPLPDEEIWRLESPVSIAN